MVIVTVPGNVLPYANVDIYVRTPHSLNSTVTALNSPSRRYYIMQILSTCPGT
jgi:hypothetical protein